ncbi:MAG: U32 family peptidase [Ruminococcaceae bacterium]|nr:U32 family peptidase [Oscillospiraceae bacterium]
MNMPELLAPAGSMESLRYALMYGADAVYLAGRSYGMRAGANNFDENELVSAAGLVHSFGKRLYLACNIVPRCHEMDGLAQWLAFAASAGVDAFIISDLGVMRTAQRVAPNVPVHISTQTGVANHETATMLHELGATRVVLARELPLSEIAELRAKTPSSLEIEAFVHGSMCVSFSGRCLISNYLTGRDANRGQCAQPCRWKYALVEETRPGQYMPVMEDERGTHILNSRDMCMIDHIPELLDAGITSLKIEGRAKSSYYTGVTVNAYRCVLDHLAANGMDAPVPQWMTEEVCKVSHREYSTGFYFGDEPGQVYDNGGYVREYEVAAVVESCDGTTMTVSQRNRFCTGDLLEAVVPGRQPVEIAVTGMVNAEGEAIDAAPHPMMTVKLPCTESFEAGVFLRRRK